MKQRSCQPGGLVLVLASTMMELVGSTLNGAFAQTTQDPQSVNLFSDVQGKQVFSFYYSVPTSPALTLAGLSADKTATSTPAKPFVLSSPTVTGGGTGTAYAADAAPAGVAGEKTASHI